MGPSMLNYAYKVVVLTSAENEMHEDKAGYHCGYTFRYLERCCTVLDYGNSTMNYSIKIRKLVHSVVINEYPILSVATRLSVFTV
jgi:hypothetical protein